MGKRSVEDDHYATVDRNKDYHHHRDRKHGMTSDGDRSGRRRDRSRSPGSPQSHKHRHHKPAGSSNSGGGGKKGKKKRKHKHRGSSSSEDSDSSSEDEETIMMKKAALMEKRKDDKKREKELLKAVETPEEKRARRLAKKEAKERKKRSQMGWDDEYMGYTNTDNPFGDANLLQTFVWKKKLEKEGKQNVGKDELEKINKLKMEESKRELEKVKKRRQERERELLEREQEREMLQRDKELEYYQVWEKQEDQFHLGQARLRSQIRIQDGRAKPIDLLAKYISAEDDDFAVEMHEPYTYLNGLTIRDLEDLLEDIKVYVEIEERGNADYWQDMTIVVGDELAKLRKMDPATAQDSHVGDRRQGIDPAVGADVLAIFRGKTHAQLLATQRHIHAKITSTHEPGVDVGYWESLLQQLKAFMARARLKDKHQQVLKEKLELLKHEQGMDVGSSDEPVFPIIPGSSGGGQGKDGKDGAEKTEEAAAAGDKDGGTAANEGEEFSEEKCSEEFITGEYSPRLVQTSELDTATVVEDPSVDGDRLVAARRQVTGYNMPVTKSEDVFEHKAREGMTSDEALFSVEHKLDAEHYLWQDKYKPRKPRFFNRVHTGFEWNKYNQTHYDLDNPPPKVVQGYKFNIFYPDLIDKSTGAPNYTLTPSPDKDFAVLRFSAGPPYEDLAFKIVNKEWEVSNRRGFRCQFYNNIFQLWFHFRRYRYRR